MKNCFMTLAFYLLATLPAHAAVTEVNCKLQKNLDTFLELPKTIKYFNEDGNIYTFDLENNKISCGQDSAKGINALLCGTPEDGLYLISKGAETILIDADTFSVLGTYSCQ